MIDKIMIEDSRALPRDNINWQLGKSECGFSGECKREGVAHKCKSSQHVDSQTMTQSQKQSYIPE